MDIKRRYNSVFCPDNLTLKDMKTKPLSKYAKNGFSSDKERRAYHLWKYAGRYIFKLMIGPFNRVRCGFLRLFGAKIGSGTSISNHVVIVFPGWLKIGNKVTIDDYVYFNATAEIGDASSLTSYVKIISGGHDVRSPEFTYEHKPVKIGSRVFVGANSLIMGGVEIGDKAAIGANSFVLHRIPENCIAYGNPCVVHGVRFSESNN